jgi:hypothetical protein
VSASQPSRSIRNRLAWFVVCLAAGAAVGMAGTWFSGNPYWYLAIPAALAVGWLWVANPDECCPPAPRRAGRAPGDDVAS